MKTNIFTLLLVICLLPITLHAQNNTNDSETVKEALEWISGKLPDIKLSKYFSGSLTTRGDTRKYDYTMAYDVATCELKITEKYAYIEDRSSSRNDFTTTTVYKLNLSDLKSIEIVDNTPYYGTQSFKITTYNSKNTIVKNDKELLNEMTIKFNQLGALKDNPDRFINAFTDAITHCGGGKKEKY